MSWRRGFFRTWIVLSGVWISVFLYFAWNAGFWLNQAQTYLWLKGQDKFIERDLSDSKVSVYIKCSNNRLFRFVINADKEDSEIDRVRNNVEKMVAKGASNEEVDRYLQAESPYGYGYPLRRNENDTPETKLEQFRNSFKELQDMPKQSLANLIYERYYTDIPKKEFYSYIGLRASHNSEACVAVPYVTVVNAPDGSKLFLFRYTLFGGTDSITEIANQFRGQWLVRWWGDAKRTVILGFLPPILLLLIGTALFWAIQGFRRQANP